MSNFGSYREAIMIAKEVRLVYRKAGDLDEASAISGVIAALERAEAKEMAEHAEAMELLGNPVLDPISREEYNKRIMEAN